MRTALKLIVALLVPVAAVMGHARAAEAPCGWFSPDPNDTRGPPIHFHAELSADEESAVTESPGTGHADFTLDRATLKLTWHITFSGLTSPPTGLYIHGPGTPGGEAGMLIDLAPHGVRSPVDGESVLNEGLVVYLVQDRMYVNLHTRKYPGGELRAPIHKLRPRC